MLHNQQVDLDTAPFKEDKLRLIENKHQLLLWFAIKKEVTQKIASTEYERIYYYKFVEKKTHVETALKAHMSDARYYELLNKIFSFAKSRIYKYNLVSYDA